MSSSSNDKPSNSQDSQPSLQDLQARLDKCQAEWDKKHKEKHPKPTGTVFPTKRNDVKPMFPRPSNP